jgi:AbrB family looped-hinge helix DNA binding protein
MKTHATAKGQIVIPAVLRWKYEIKAGTKIIVDDNGGEIILRPITEKYLRKLQGSLKGTDLLDVLLGERQKDKSGEQ